MQREEHPGKRHGDFAEGVDETPDAPSEELQPDFARGVRKGPEEETEHEKRFSEGVEQTPEDAPDKNVERRFSQGVERSPTSE
jgi:hypothetical protein